MAGVNRYYRSNIYEGSLYSPPIDVVAGTLENLQKRYDTNYAIAEEIKNNFIDSLPQDRELANQLQSEYSKAIDNVVAKYNGDYSQAGRELQKTLSTIQKDYGPGGRANAILSNFKSYNDWVAANKDLVEKGKILGEDFNLANAYYMNNYQGVGEINPITGEYNRLNPETLTEYVNPDELIQNAYKTFKPQKYKVGRTIFQNGIQSYVEQEVEGITPDRLYPTFKEVLNRDPKFYNYLRQRAKFEGTNPDDVERVWDEYAKQRATDLSYMNTSDIEKSERDPLYMMQQKEALRHHYRQQEKNEMMSQLGAMFKYEPSVDVMKRQESTIDPENWRKMSTEGTTVVGPVFTGSGRTRPAEPGEPNAYRNMFGQLVVNVPVNEEYKGTLKDNINNQKFIAQTKIQPQLMQTIFDDMASNNPNFTSKYGKDKKWTEEFDNSVVKAYKKEEPSHIKTQPISMRIASPDARKEISLELAGQLGNPENVAVYEVGSNMISTAKDLGLKAEDLIDEENRLKKNFDISYVLPGKGYAAAGYRINVGGKSYVIVDQDMDRKAASQQLESAYNPIYFEGKNEGNVIPIGSANGQQVYGKPILSYKKDGNGYKEVMEYELMEIDPKSGSWKSTNKKVQANDTDIYSNYLPYFDKALGQGASKSDLTFFRLLSGELNDE